MWRPHTWTGLQIPSGPAHARPQSIGRSYGFSSKVSWLCSPLLQTPATACLPAPMLPVLLPSLMPADRGNLKTCPMMSLPSKAAARKGLASPTSPPRAPPHPTSLHSSHTGLLPVPPPHSSANVPPAGSLLCTSPSLRGHPLFPTSGSHPSLSLDDYNPLRGDKHWSVPMQMRVDWRGCPCSV